MELTVFAIDADADSRVEGHLRMDAGLDEHIGSQRALRGTLVRDDDQLDTAFFDSLEIGEPAEGEPDQAVLLRKVHEVLKHSVIRGRDMDDVRGAHAQKVRAQLRHAAAKAQPEHIAVAAGENGLCHKLEGLLAVLFKHRRYDLLIALYRAVLLGGVRFFGKEADDGADLLGGEICDLTLNIALELRKAGIAEHLDKTDDGHVAHSDPARNFGRGQPRQRLPVLQAEFSDFSVRSCQMTVLQLFFQFSHTNSPNKMWIFSIIARFRPQSKCA